MDRATVEMTILYMHIKLRTHVHIHTRTSTYVQIALKYCNLLIQTILFRYPHLSILI